MKFIDTAKIIIASGSGGAGHISFRREKYVPKGGPDGGNGGKGGDVIIKADSHLNTLLDFKYKTRYLAQNGKPGGKSRKSGSDGKNLIIRVPVGTVVKNAADDELIADLDQPDSLFIVAAGGKGGLGNAEFATPTKRTPRYAQPGVPGIEIEILLELKLLADVGIVGLPNVGKSTLISVISDAKPKIADYPFTTLIPNLGVVRIAEGKSFTVADIPGIIEGAHRGKGLGLQFLRHIERTRLLIFMIDSNSEDPKADYKLLSKELTRYKTSLKEKKRLIVFSKADTIDPDTQSLLEKYRLGKGLPKPIVISAVTGQSVDKLKWAMWESLNG